MAIRPYISNQLLYVIIDGWEILNFELLMPIFVKIEAGIVDKATFDRYVPAHKEYVRELIAKGHKARTGYWVEGGGGMLIFEASSLEEAKAIVARDPLVKNSCVEYELHQWCIVVE
jgi:uncharacterized protein YciI